MGITLKMSLGVWLLFLCYTVPVILADCCNPVSVSGTTHTYSSSSTREEYGADLSPNGLYHQSSWIGARPPRVKEIFILSYDADTKMWELAIHTPGRLHIIGAPGALRRDVLRTGLCSEMWTMIPWK